MSNTPGSPYGDLPRTENAATGLDVKDPHENHGFTEQLRRQRCCPVGCPIARPPAGVGVVRGPSAARGGSRCGVRHQRERRPRAGGGCAAKSHDAGKGLGVFNMANAMPQSVAPGLGAALLAAKSDNNQNHDLLLCTAGPATLIGALVVLPIKKVR